MNLYGFCGNNAINRWDLLGMVVITMLVPNGTLFDPASRTYMQEGDAPANAWSGQFFYDDEADVYFQALNSAGTATSATTPTIRAGSYSSTTGFNQVNVLNNGMVVTRGWWGLGKEQIYWASPEATAKYLDGVLGTDRTLLLGAVLIGAIWPGADPSKGPPGTEWRGKPGSTPGDGDGNYYDPNTGESYRPDLQHPDPIGPHWDYRDKDGNWYRVYPDGRTEPKEPPK